MKWSFVFAGILLMGMLAGLASCERDFHIDLKTGDPELVVEAYINNELPTFNYVVLTFSQGYYDTSVQSIPVTGATIGTGQLKKDWWKPMCPRYRVAPCRVCISIPMHL
jgi:hypothetical protein